jgi:hypothetical protein
MVLTLRPATSIPPPHSDAIALFWGSYQHPKKFTRVRFLLIVKFEIQVWSRLAMRSGGYCCLVDVKIVVPPWLDNTAQKPSNAGLLKGD